METANPAAGGNDTINTGGDRDIILGGFGNDTINAGEGNNIVIGDNGKVVLANGLSKTIETTADSLGGRDNITTGTGNDVVLGGFADDTLTLGTGNNIVIGDNGKVDYTVDDDPVTVDLIYTTSPDLTNADDAIASGNGNDIILAGNGNDNISAGDGSNIAIGDSGKISSAAGKLHRIETTDSNLGGNDTITTGSGEDIVLGGFTNDTLTTNASNDIALGDNGYISYVESDNDPSDINTIAKIRV